MREFSKYCKALSFALERHHGVTRNNNITPYIVHPLRITAILRAAGISELENEDIFIAALFHDLVEDTDTTLEEIEKEFGKKVATIVNELTNPEQTSKLEWLESFKKASMEAKMVKMADRIDNLLDMRVWSIERQKKYAEHGRVILKQCGSANVKLAVDLKKITDDIIDYYEQSK